MTHEIDWKAIIEPVAIHLKGEPNHRRKHGSELRWGSKGSFAVYTDTAAFTDYEENVSGGVIKLVMHEKGIDETGAWQWLKDNNFVNSTLSTHSRGRNRPCRRITPIRQNATPPTNTDKGTLFYGLQLWNESESIPRDASHPVRKWLRNRNLLPPNASIPAQIRYHRAKGLILCIVASLQAWGKSLPHTLPKPEAIHAIAIDENGHKRRAFGERDKTTYGRSHNCLVFLIGDKDGKRVNICEGVADALAIYTYATGPTIATITTISKINDELFLKALANRETHLYSDSDQAGQKAAQELTKRINRHGGTVKIHRDSAAKDPAQAAQQRKDIANV